MLNETYGRSHRGGTRNSSDGCDESHNFVRDNKGGVERSRDKTGISKGGLNYLEDETRCELVETLSGRYPSRKSDHKKQ